MMSIIEVFAVAAVILLSVLVGVAIPSLLQLRSTLKSLQALLDETRPKLGAVLDQATEAASRVNRAAAGIEEGTGKIRGAVDSIAGLVATVESVREPVRKTAAVLSAVAPALLAGFRAFWPAGDPDSHPAAEPGGSPESKESESDRSPEEAS
jgi:uncharacterized protein YoxC